MSSEWPPERSPEPADGNGTVDLLGLVAVTRLAGFERAAAAASLTAEFADKMLLANFAVRSFERFTQARDRLTALGADPDAAMRPFLAAVESFHQRTVPADALEALAKAYITVGIIADFFRELAAGLADRDAVDPVLADIGQVAGGGPAGPGEPDTAMADRIRAAAAADPRAAQRLTLWTRRVLGEALAKAVQVVAARQSLADLLPVEAAEETGEPGEPDRHQVERVFRRLSERHAERMIELGLRGR
jgi:hypothetical protein